MTTSSDLKRGARIELEGEPWVVVDLATQGPTARGGNTLVRVKLRSLRTGQLSDHTFKAGERVQVPDFEIRPSQFLYDEGGELYYFMDQETYEQFPLSRDQLEGALPYLRPNDEVRALFFNGGCIGVELPHTMVLEVREAEQAVRGDTATAAQKTAILETGLEIQVPLFIETGDRIVVDTREARYVRRA